MTYDERVKARKESLLKKAAVAKERSNKLFLQADKMAGAIPVGQPVHGAKDRAYRNKIDDIMRRATVEKEKAEELEEQAKCAGTGGISTGDKDAIEKLMGQLKEAEVEHARTLAANKILKLTNKIVVSEGLKKLGYSQNDIAWAMEQGDVGGSTETAKIRRIKKRIAYLQKLAKIQEKPQVLETEMYTLKLEENYYQFVFDEKPSDEIREILKKHGFRWSPSRGSWGRLAVGSGRWAMIDVRKDIEKISKVVA